MATSGVSGVINDPWLYGVGPWNNIGGLVGSFLVILNLKWVTTIRLDFGIMCDVGIKPLR